MTAEVPRRLRPSAEQRKKTIATKTKGAPSSQGAVSSARPVTTTRRTTIFVPPPTGGLDVRSTPSGNTAAGVSALASNVTSSGNHNTGFGDHALSANIDADYNSAFGEGTLANSNSNSNSGFGFAVLVSLLTGSFNAVFGAFAGGSIDTGSHNAIFGEESGLDLADGSYNTIVGQGAGNNGTLVSGSYNTLVGNATNTASDLSGTVVVGIDSTGTGAQATADDQYVLGTANHIAIVKGKLVIADNVGGLHQIVVSTGGALSTVAYP